LGKFELKVPGGKLLKVTCETENKMIQSVKISGDFFLHPEETIVILEKNLVGATIDKGSISKIVKEFVQKGNIFIGVEADHIVEATLHAAQLESS
jgi:lipoate-protein ligase A